MISLPVVGLGPDLRLSSIITVSWDGAARPSHCDELKGWFQVYDILFFFFIFRKRNRDSYIYMYLEIMLLTVNCYCC
jgi:hypothetical protein